MNSGSFKARRWRESDFLLFALYAILGIYLFYSSWLRWPDAGVDFGYFLYNAWQFSEGARFGEHFHYYYGPLALVFYSLLFKFFGVSILVVYWANFFLLSCTTFLVHRFFCHFSKYVAGLATLSFLGVFALGQYIFQANYNFMAPYKPEISLGTPLLILTTHLFLKLQKSAGVRLSVGAGFCLGLLLLTSTELALAALGILFVAFFSSPSFLRRESIFLLLGLLLGPTLSLFYFYFLQPVANPLLITFRTFEVLSHNSLIFADSLKELMGLDRPIFRLAIILRVFSFFALIGMLFAILGKSLKPSLIWIFALIPLLVVAILEAQISYWLYFPKLLPILPLLGLLWWIGDRQNRFHIGLWSILSLLLLTRILGNAMFHYYGFSLAFPAYLLLFPLLCEVAPQLWERLFSSTRGFPPFAVAIGICTLYCALTIRQPFFMNKNFTVAEKSDVLFDWNPDFSQRGLAMKALMDDIRLRNPHGPILGLPDGHMVNYLLRIQRPYPYSLSLGELFEFGEEKILRSYQESNPQIIFVAEPEEYDDKNGFGQRYGRSILDWVKSEYKLVKQYGRPVKFSLYERK